MPNPGPPSGSSPAPSPPGAPWPGVAERVRRAASAKARRDADDPEIVLEGLRVVERALRVGLPLRAALAGEGFWRDPAPWPSKVRRALALARVPVSLAPDAAMTDLVRGRTFGDVVAVAARPPARSLTAGLVDARGDTGHRPVALVLEDVRDPGNVGALARTALVSGCSALVLAGRQAVDPWHPKAVRTAMGALFKLHVLTAETATLAGASCAAAGLTRVGAVSSGGDVCWAPAAHIDLGPTALWLGSEAHGLSGEALAQLDRQWTVPMAPGVDSFSINAAAAVLLHELRRPRPG